MTALGTNDCCGHDVPGHYPSCSAPRGSSCSGCKTLRAEIVEALQGVDISDFDSMEGSSPRGIGAILKDIASRLEALGRQHEEG